MQNTQKHKQLLKKLFVHFRSSRTLLNTQGNTNFKLCNSLKAALAGVWFIYKKIWSGIMSLKSYFQYFWNKVKIWESLMSIRRLSKFYYCPARKEVHRCMDFIIPQSLISVQRRFPSGPWWTVAVPLVAGSIFVFSRRHGCPRPTRSVGPIAPRKSVVVPGAAVPNDLLLGAVTGGRQGGPRGAS